jgi:hypothetical protein
MKRILLVLALLGALIAPAESRAGSGPPACTTIASGTVTRTRAIKKGVLWEYEISAKSTGICSAYIEEIYVLVEWDDFTHTTTAGGGGKQSHCLDCYAWWVYSYGTFDSTSYYPCITVRARAIFIGGEGDDHDTATVCAQ